MTNLINQSLGRYHILEQLGEGGMATVYKAYDTRLERDVAIKIIRRAAFPPDQLERMLKRFEREARSLAKLSHPNIVTVLDYGEHEGAPYLVMEYLPGGTLKDKLTISRLSWQESVRLITPIVQALAYAHQNHIIHRDIKPSNILITQSGESMLSDFGIAKILEGAETAELTSTSTGIGTPEYMAPEQGLGRSDERSDIYAVGIVLYQMITRHVPFRADTPMAVLLKKNTEPLPRPTQYVPGLPAKVENVLIKALARDPDQRFQNMGLLAKALDMQANQKNMTGPATAVDGYGKAQSPLGAGKGRSGWIPWVTGTGVLAACCGLIVFLAVVWRQAASQKDLLHPPTNITETPTPLSIAVTPSPIFTATSTSVSLGYDLAFVSDRDNGFANLRAHIVNLNNPAEYQVFENPGGYESGEWPSFCGQGLAMEVIDLDHTKPQWIYLFNQGDSPEKWNDSANMLGVPRCSPDGQYMAYSAQNGDYWDLVIAELGGRVIYSPKVHSYGKIAGYASWYGTSLSFIFEVISPGDMFLQVDNFPTSPTLSGVLDLGKGGVHATVSPDGTQAAFECNEGQLCVMDLVAGETRNIYQTSWDVNLGWTERVTPVWSGDGLWIYFATVDGGDWDIFRIHPDGSGAENITSDWPSNEINPALRW